jgi:O-antigen/teichoic acid export membrane protein
LRIRNFSLFLLPTVFQGALSVLTLPLYTYVLDPADYGAFALLVALTAPFPGVAALGSGYLLSAHFPTADETERRDIVSTTVAAGLLGIILLVLLFLSAWLAFASRAEILRGYSLTSVVLLLAGIVLAFPWQIGSIALILTGRSRDFALIVILQICAGAIATILGLYVFDLGRLSLFLASAVGGAVLGTGTIAALRRYVGGRMTGRWLGEIRRLAPSAVAGNLAESSHVAVERTVLSSHVGLAALGLYNHSEAYRQVMMAGLKAVSNSVLPETLAEARQPETRFPTTGRIWRAMHLAITGAGVLFALVGADMLRILTHDKFTPASTLVAAWMVLLLLKHSGRAQYGFLLAANEGRYLGRLTLASVVIGLAGLFLLVPLAGVWGALGAAAIQQLVYRAGVVLRAGRQTPFPFQDTWIFAGSGVVLGSLAWVALVEPSFTHRLAALLVLELLLGLGAVRALFPKAALWSVFARARPAGRWT